MNELLKKIFEEVLIYEEDVSEMINDVDIKICEITENYKKKLSDDELEDLQGHFYQIALLSQQEGFQLGVKYTINTLISLLSES